MEFDENQAGAEREVLAKKTQSDRPRSGEGISERLIPQEALPREPFFTGSTTGINKDGIAQADPVRGTVIVGVADADWTAEVFEESTKEAQRIFFQRVQSLQVDRHREAIIVDGETVNARENTAAVATVGSFLEMEVELLRAMTGELAHHPDRDIKTARREIPFVAAKLIHDQISSESVYGIALSNPLARNLESFIDNKRLRYARSRTGPIKDKIAALRTAHPDDSQFINALETLKHQPGGPDEPGLADLAHTERLVLAYDLAASRIIDPDNHEVMDTIRTADLGTDELVEIQAIIEQVRACKVQQEREQLYAGIPRNPDFQSLSDAAKLMLFLQLERAELAPKGLKEKTRLLQREKIIFATNAGDQVSVLRINGLGQVKDLSADIKTVQETTEPMEILGRELTLTGNRPVTRAEILEADDLVVIAAIGPEHDQETLYKLLASARNQSPEVISQQLADLGIQVNAVLRANL